MQRYLNPSPQALGLLFEDEIHELLIQTKLQVLRENDIVRKYGLNLKGIDHLVYGIGYIICIQDKVTSSSPTLSLVNHFIQCVENIGHKEKIKCVGIYLTKQPLTKPGKLALLDANKRNINLFLEIQDEDLPHLKHKLLSVLYENQIYLYESDDSLYMLPARYEKS